MKLTKRSYRGEQDYWQMRAFLREVLLLNDRRMLSWHLNRLDYWRWHGIENIDHTPLEDVVTLWETSDGQIAAALNPEGTGGDVFFQVHPHHRTPALEEHMLAVAEERLSVPAPQGGRFLRVFADQSDTLRRSMLQGCGYTLGEWPEYQRRRSLLDPIPTVSVAAGYTVRALGDESELPARSYVSWQAFHPDEPDSKYDGWEWYHNIQRAPLYRRDLDIVAVAPDGSHAAFCTAWFDDVTRTGVFEPVGTAPAHQRKGLGKAVMSLAMSRLKILGADLAYVSSYSPGAHALYASAGFTTYDLCEPWEKQWA
jgi:GNAT superfamily N-acetyltransferase